MKHVVVLFVAIALAIALSACVANQTESEVVEGQSSMFVKIEDGPMWNVYYHKDTKVMYVVSYGTHNTGTFTVLLNPDGTPMCYEEE